jgi:uncharacterized protein (DUF4415 family)
MNSAAKPTLQGYTQEDWDEVSDNPEITPERFAEAVAAKRRLPDAVMKSIERRRPRGPQKAPTKQLVSVRLDREVIEHFKAQGPGWQTRMNDALRTLIAR